MKLYNTHTYNLQATKADLKIKRNGIMGHAIAKRNTSSTSPKNQSAAQWRPANKQKEMCPLDVEIKTRRALDDLLLRGDDLSLREDDLLLRGDNLLLEET